MALSMIVAQFDGLSACDGRDPAPRRASGTSLDGVRRGGRARRRGEPDRGERDAPPPTLARPHRRRRPTARRALTLRPVVRARTRRRAPHHGRERLRQELAPPTVAGLWQSGSGADRAADAQPHDVPPAAAVHDPGQPPRPARLPAAPRAPPTTTRSRRAFETVNLEEVLLARGRRPRARDRLGERALARRAAARVVRAPVLEEARRRLPRRGDERARRGRTSACSTNGCASSASPT